MTQEFYFLLLYFRMKALLAMVLCVFLRILMYVLYSTAIVPFAHFAQCYCTPIQYVPYEESILHYPMHAMHTKFVHESHQLLQNSKLCKRSSLHQHSTITQVLQYAVCRLCKRFVFLTYNILHKQCTMTLYLWE